MGSGDEMPNNPPLPRNEGATPSERFLNQLCDRSFLSLWSHPGLFRARGKELCDLLVVCGDDVVIFSDKRCRFPVTEDIELSWARWFRAAVAESVTQATRAVGWLRARPHEVYLDRKARRRFPLEIPKRDAARFHVVVVAHGVTAPCKALLGGSGSLIIDNTLRGAAAHTEPFVIGDITPDGPFVHVLTEATLEIVMNALDTITDFVQYLQRKERFLRGERRIAAAGEEDLLGFFLKDVGSDQQHDFVFPAHVGDIVIAEGSWEHIAGHSQRRAKLEADRVSYLWDGLIEAFSRHAMAGTQYSVWPNGLESTERIVRFMAREPRLRRRILARHLLEALRTTPAHMRRIRVAGPSSSGDPYYAFVLVPYSHEHSYDENRAFRRSYLEAVCLVMKLKFPEANDIIGIATNSGRGEEGSEDAIYLDARVWTPEMQAQAERDQADFGILVAPEMARGTEAEYPEL
jgi:hypothetical protein